jgi:DNA-directed RNA polymerase specialized sigma24 family protein
VERQRKKLVQVCLLPKMDQHESDEDIEIDAEILAQGRGKRITPAQRMEIIHLSKINWSQRRIQRRLGVSRTTIKLWIDRYRDELNVTPHVNENGRPRKTDEHEEFLLCCSG